MKLRYKVLNSIKFKSLIVSKKRSNFFRQVILICTSLLGGACVFLLSIIIFFNITFLNKNFQKEILRKSDAYMQIDHITREVLSNFIQSLPVENELKNMLSDSYATIDSQVIKDGIDSLVDGLLEYTKGETNLLPNIYIGNQFFSIPKTEFDKINLESILLYFNKSHLLDVLIVIKQIFQLLKPVPLIICLFILLLICFGIITSSSKRDLLNWWRLFFLATGILGASLTFFIVNYLINFSSNSLNMHLNSSFLLLFDEKILNTLLVYINEILYNLLYSIISLTMLQILVSIILSFIVNGRYLHLDNSLVYRNKKPLFVLISILSVFLIQNLYYFKESCQLNNPANAFYKIANYGTVSEVITATDHTIYSLEVKINDDKTGDPISDIRVKVVEILNTFDIIDYSSNFIADLPIQANFKAVSTTDKDGTVNIVLNKGLYKLELSSSKSEYVLPEPFLVDIKLAGKNSVSLNVTSN